MIAILDTLELLESQGCLEVVRWMTSGVNACGQTGDTLFPVIQNEGIFALTLLCSSTPSNHTIHLLINQSKISIHILG